MLKIFKDTNDHSIALDNYLEGSSVLSLNLGETIDIGYYKPINSLFIELVAQNSANNIILEFWSGSSWSVLETVDRTLGLKKSGFVQWERNLDIQVTNLLHGLELYWYKISVDTTNIPSLELKGVNLVFSDDSDLREAYPDIMTYLHDGDTSFIAYHQGARNYIITYLRNKGKVVVSLGVYKLLDQFDLHNYEEIRQAAKFKALAMIFFNESNAVDDKWYQKAKDFEKLYSDSVSMNFLSLDLNDDGKIESSESQAIQYVTIQRL